MSTTLKITAMAVTLVSTLAFGASGCGSSTKDETPVGTLVVGAYTLDIHQERDAVAAGATSRFVIKTSGGMPTTVTGWIGTADATGSVKKAASYDPGDSDWDDDVTAPSPIPAGSKFWVEVTDATGKKDVGSIAWTK